MRIGIIAERKITSHNPFDRYSSEIISSPKNPFELIILRAPFSVEKLGKTPPNRIKKVVLKSSGLLKSLGSDKIIAVSALREYFPDAVTNRHLAFISNIPHCIRTVAPKCGIHLPDCQIGIRASKLDRITENLVYELCYDTKKLTLSICDNGDFQGFRERLYNETGFFVEITHHRSIDADILIDIRQPMLRIGRDVLIDGIQFDLELGGCDVDFLEVAECIKTFDMQKKISAYTMGKKKLTL